MTIQELLKRAQKFVNIGTAYMEGKTIERYERGTKYLLESFNILQDQKAGIQRDYSTIYDYEIRKPMVLRPWTYEEIPTGAVVACGSQESVIVRKFPPHGRVKQPTVRLGGYGNTSVSVLSLMRNYKMVVRREGFKNELKDCGVGGTGMRTRSLQAWEKKLEARANLLTKMEKDFAKRMEDWGKEAVGEELNNSRRMASDFPNVHTWSLHASVGVDKIQRRMNQLECQIAELKELINDLAHEVSRRRLKR